MNTLEPIIRNGLRVLAGYIIAKGGDPELTALLYSPEVAGIIVLAATEGWYWLAKRKGWAT